MRYFKLYNKHENLVQFLHVFIYSTAIFVILYAFVYQWRHVTTSRVLHDGLLQGIMRAPISFFETTPIGRILNRLSQDVDSLDSFVFFFLEICVEHALFAFGILAVISYSMPMLIIFTVPTVVAIYFCLVGYLSSLIITDNPSIFSL